jgi:hypothetical protein
LFDANNPDELTSRDYDALITKKINPRR